MAKPKMLLPAMGAYMDGILDTPNIECQNLWTEKGEPGSGTPYKLLNPPGAGVDLTSASFGGQINGFFQQDGIFAARGFVFSDDGVTELRFPGTTSGSEPNSPSLDASWKSSLVPTQISAAFGASIYGHVPAAAIRGFVSWVSNGTAYIYDGATVQAVAGLPTTIRDVTALSKRFLWSDSATDQVYYSDLSTGTFNALNFFTAETISDRLKAIHVHGNNLYLSGELTTEIWRTATNSDNPYAYTGVSIPIGTAGYGTWADTAGFCAFVGNGADGYGVYQVSGSSVRMISTPWISRLLESLNSAQHLEVFAQAYGQEGHTLYELNIPRVELNGLTVQGVTLTYDTTSKEWYRHFDPSHIDGYNPRFVRSMFGAQYFARRFDDGGTEGDLGRFDRTSETYMGNEMPVVWSAMQPSDRKFNTDEIVQQIQMTNNARAYVNGTIDYDYSDNLGRTFRDARTVTVYEHPNYGQTAHVRGLGESKMPGRIHRFKAQGLRNYEIGPIFIDNEGLQNV